MTDIEYESPKNPGNKLSEKNINKAVWKEAALHPTTLYPAAVSILGSAYTALLNLNPTVLAIVLAGGVVSLGSMIFHYFVRWDQLAQKYAQSVKAEIHNDHLRTAVDLEAECNCIGFEEGRKEVLELRSSFERLNQFLKDQYAQKMNLTASRFLVLAEETYLQSLQLIGKATLIFRALKEIDRKKLVQEKGSLERERAAAIKNDKEARDSYMDVLNIKIDSIQKRLLLYEERKKTLDQLLAQCEILESSLDSAYLEVVDLVGTDAWSKRTDVAANLQRAVKAARKVEERLTAQEQDWQYTKNAIKSNPGLKGGNHDR